MAAEPSGSWMPRSLSHSNAQITFKGQTTPDTRFGEKATESFVDTDNPVADKSLRDSIGNAVIIRHLDSFCQSSDS